MDIKVLSASFGVAAVVLAAVLKTTSLPPDEMPGGQVVAVSSQAVPLNAADPKQDRVGDLIYAGGFPLTSNETSRLHGLSDLEVFPDGRLVAVGDEGDLVRGRIETDPQGKLTRMVDVRITKLVDLGGKPLQSKEESDAEGLAVLSNGDMLVSFERHHRIWLYPADGSLPHEVPAPAATFPENGGMEALTTDSSRGRGAYIVGAEESGQTWRCAIRAACSIGPLVAMPEGFGLVAARELPGGRTAWLLRSFSPLAGNVVILRITDQQGRTIDQQAIRRPLTVDNFEGMSAVPRGNGTIRFYLISDDNFSSSQRTLLLAFDWTAARR